MDVDVSMFRSSIYSLTTPLSAQAVSTPPTIINRKHSIEAGTRRRMVSFRRIPPLSVAVIRHAVSGLSERDVQSLRTREKMRLLSVLLSPDDSHHRYDSSLLQLVSVAAIILTD